MSRHKFEIYVDGSFINGATGYGAVVLENGKVVDELSGAVDASEVNETRQVAGELVAVKEALNWCCEHSVAEVSIYYDYLGIEKWATRQWKTNQPLTKDYARFMGECPIKIHWHKVDSHTGNLWNDRADALAKQGAGLGQSAVGQADSVSELIGKTDAWIEFLAVRELTLALIESITSNSPECISWSKTKPSGLSICTTPGKRGCRRMFTIFETTI